MLCKDIYTNYGTVGLTEWPDGEAGWSGPTEKPDRATRVAFDTQWANRADGHPDRCPTEGGRAPDRGGQVPDGGRTGTRRRAKVAQRRARWASDGGQGLGGWPNRGLYKCCWPSFLGTLLLCPVTHARNAGVHGANQWEWGPLRGEFWKECSPPQCFSKFRVELIIVGKI
jgi:hypothetical protein